MPELPVRAIGVPWYRPETWERLRRIFRDTHLLPETYDAWLAKAEQVVQQVRDQGGIAEKVDIDPDTFPKWCRDRGLKIDAKARMRFAADAVARMHGQTH